jgi:DNA recombination protein RmuC
MSSHLDRLGRSLTGAVTAYNRAIGSLENRVLVSARRFEELGIGAHELRSPPPLVDAIRTLSAGELLEEVAEQRPELPEASDRPGRGSVRRVAP